MNYLYEDTTNQETQLISEQTKNQIFILRNFQ